MKRTSQALAAILVVALSACGGPTAPSSTPVLPPVGAPAGPALLVGVGDSLTAGYQSSALLGDPTVTSPLSAYPGNAVPPGQEVGWFADMYNAMAGVPNAAAVVLPLIKGPGLANQLVLNKTTLFASTHLPCDSFNNAAFGATTWQSVRLNPTSTPLDVAVPGITMHEAVAMTAPLTGPQSPNSAGTGCNAYPSIPGDATSGGLQSLVAGESLMFYPILGNFQSSLGGNLTMLNAAASLHGQIATVWLGANDLLKFAFSAEKSPVTDTPQQLGADLTKIITTLQKSGSKVLVADLPTLIPAPGAGRPVPQFFGGATLVPDIATLLVVSSNGLISPGNAGLYAQGVVAALETNPNLPASGGWYLTETGFLATVQQALAAIQANPAAPNFAAISLDPSGAGSGNGGAYLSPKIVTDLQTLNAAYNQVIDQIASSSGSGVALVPINTLFTQAATTGVPVGPQTLTLQFGGGLVSWDGLHPSNAGYAVIANAFIATANTAFGLSPAIPPVSTATAAASDPYNPALVNAGLGSTVFPLP